MIAGGDRNGFFVVVSAGGDADFADELRSSTISAFIACRPIVVHDLEDELEMARWAEAIWPGPKTNAIRAAIEREWEGVVKSPAVEPRGPSLDFRAKP